MYLVCMKIRNQFLAIQKCGAKIATVVMVLLYASVLHAADSLKVTFNAIAQNGQYAPTYIAAVWVMDAKNVYIRTLGRITTTKNDHESGLTEWFVQSKRDLSTDIIMGATPNSPGATQVTKLWDFKNKNGVEVPSGIYYVRLVQSDGTKSPLLALTIDKNGKSTKVTGKNTGFSNVVADYVSDGTLIPDGSTGGLTDGSTGGSIGGSTGGSTGGNPVNPGGDITSLNCGDNVINGNELCDNTDFGTQTCKDFSFLGGQLQCTDQCKFDFSRCFGDGKSNAIATGEPEMQGCQTMINVGAGLWLSFLVLLWRRRR